MQHRLCIESFDSKPMSDHFRVKHFLFALVEQKYSESNTKRYLRYEIIISDLLDSIVDQSGITFFQNLKLVNNDLDLVS